MIVIAFMGLQSTRMCLYHLLLTWVFKSLWVKLAYNNTLGVTSCLFLHCGIYKSQLNPFSVVGQNIHHTHWGVILNGWRCLFQHQLSVWATMSFHTVPLRIHSPRSCAPSKLAATFTLLGLFHKSSTHCFCSTVDLKLGIVNDHGFHFDQFQPNDS